MCLIIATSKFSNRLVFQVVDDQTGEPVPEGAVGTSVVLLMVRDAYANYVVQTTLDVVVDGTQKHMLMEELNAHSTELVSSCTFILVIFLCLVIVFPHDAASKEKLYICKTHCHKIGNLVPSYHSVVDMIGSSVSPYTRLGHQLDILLKAGRPSRKRQS